MRAIILFLLIQYCLMPVYGQNKAPLKEVIFNTSWYPQAQFAGYFVAEKKGFYKKYGIKTNFIFSNYDFGVKKNLSEGKADLGIMWLHEGILAHNENDQLINIAQFIDTSNILIVARNKNINSLGIWKPYVKFLKSYVHELLSDTIEIVPLRNGTEAFVLGAVDAITVMNYNEFNQLINSGVDVKSLYVYTLSKMGLLLPEDGIYCTRNYYEQNKELCGDFITASLEGWKYAFENIEEAVGICLEYTETSNYYSNSTIQKLMLNTIKNIIAEREKKVIDIKLNKDAFERMVKYLLDKEFITEEIKYEQFCRGIR